MLETYIHANNHKKCKKNLQKAYELLVGRMTASPVMYASRAWTQMILRGVFTEIWMILPSQCD